MLQGPKVCPSNVWGRCGCYLVSDLWFMHSILKVESLGISDTLRIGDKLDNGIRAICG